tara:strand:+ start:697 stop:1380 length:684 start_codon:yes stop_codon:yes gene_type:complete
MKYFNELSHVYYGDSEENFKVVCDIFKRVRVRLEAQSDRAVYYEYQIKDGDTPENISHRYYGSVDYYWVVLLMNEIIDPDFDWPLGPNAFEIFLRKKYGVQLDSSATYVWDRQKILAGDTTDYHETVEFKAPNDIYGLDGTTILYSKNDVILDAGTPCNSHFTFTYWDGSENVTLPKETVVSTINARTKEYRKNEAKRNIKILDERYLADFVKEFRRLVESIVTFLG